MRVRSHRSRIALHLIAAGALTATMVLTAAAPALGHHCSGDGSIRDRGGDVIAECHGKTPGRPPTSGSHEYLWNLYCRSVEPFAEGYTVQFLREGPLTEEEVAQMGFDPTGEYSWFVIVCWHDGEGTDVGSIVVEDNPPIPPEELRDRARARIEPPAPLPATSPPLDQMTYVQMATWLWLDEAGWAPITESETAGFTTVTVSATPVEALWELGDGDPVVCVGPGVEWTQGAPEDGTYCSFTYVRSSYGLDGGRFGASVSVRWVFEWWINDRPQGVFGELVLSTDFSVAVAEIHALETGG